MRRFCERAERSVKAIRSSFGASRLRRTTFAFALLASAICAPQAARADYGFIAIDNFVAVYLGNGLWTVNGKVDGTVDTAGLPVYIGGVADALVVTDEDGFFSYTFALNPRMQGGIVSASVLELDNFDFYTVEAMLLK